MTFAWYGHLKFKHAALWHVILISWGIAFFEYVLQVPANRVGYGQFNGFQLKTIQEVLSLVVFTGFAVFYLIETLRWNYIAGHLYYPCCILYVQRMVIKHCFILITPKYSTPIG